jgi:hypothetical protein
MRSYCTTHATFSFLHYHVFNNYHIYIYVYIYIYIYIYIGDYFHALAKKELTDHTMGGRGTAPNTKGISWTLIFMYREYILWHPPS